MHILDTHLHLVYPDQLSYPWLENAPAINKAWTAPSYFAEAEKLGITRALHMEVDVAEADMLAETKLVGALDERIVGAIASARPESPDFPKFLDSLRSLGHVKGIRRILHESPDDLSQTETFTENLNLLGKVGLPFDLCTRENQTHIAIHHIDSAPHTQFVLDHCGNPAIANGDFKSWKNGISEVAKRENVVGKISGIIAYNPDGWSVDSLRPYVEHMIDAFGWDRVVWGSDHPVCTLTANLTKWVEATRQIIANEDEANQAKLLHLNAERVYNV